MASPRTKAVVSAVLVQGVGLAGFGVCMAGVWRVYEPAAMIAGGALAVAWTVLKVRSAG